MTDTPPDWAIERACAVLNAEKDGGQTYSFWRPAAHCEHSTVIAFARYIAEREQPPVDLLLIEAREICSIIEGQNKGYQFTSGERDDYPSMQIALAALRRGIELAKEPK